MTTSMVERVARALCAYCSGPNVIDPAPAWDEISEIERNEWRGEARVAIERMRKPTDGMIAAAGHIGVGRDGDTAAEVALEAWQAMIDEAIKG